jgi:hypothetical protein
MLGLSRPVFLLLAFFLAMACCSVAFAEDGAAATPLSVRTGLEPVPYSAASAQSALLERRARVLDKKFVGMSVLAMGLTIADIESTQSCLRTGKCHELNPTLPHSHLGMYAVNVPINSAAMYLSYRLKASGHRSWWLAPVVISSAHGVGAVFTF